MTGGFRRLRELRVGVGRFYFGRSKVSLGMILVSLCYRSRVRIEVFRETVKG